MVLVMYLKDIRHKKGYKQDVWTFKSKKQSRNEGFLG